MVFAGYVDVSMSHHQWEMLSMDTHEDDHPIIEATGNTHWTLDCCPDTSESSMEKNSNTPLSLKDVLMVVSLERYPLGDTLKGNINITINALYRSNAPPDPGEYISLIGSSIKKLN